ncbi:hypothetical protein M8818_004794 [Zalaria obscura]|uniref:Uncharacterized protein n=1 Tax=Zalaria obscura TaxID=2024903 RepID=A0ACC3SAK9_9PEZI
MSSIRAVASAAALFAMFSRCAAQCSVQDGVKVTFFGYPDNGPPEGSESNISCGWPDLTADRGESCGGKQAIEPQTTMSGLQTDCANPWLHQGPAITGIQLHSPPLMASSICARSSTLHICRST